MACLAAYITTAGMAQQVITVSLDAWNGGDRDRIPEQRIRSARRLRRVHAVHMDARLPTLRPAERQFHHHVRELSRSGQPGLESDARARARLVRAGLGARRATDVPVHEH